MTNQTTKLGAGPEVSRIALGCMGMAGMYGDTDDTESIATIHAALERGITLLDTGDFYGNGRSELLIGRALRDRRDQALLSVKFGVLRAPDGRGLLTGAKPTAPNDFRAHLPRFTGENLERNQRLVAALERLAAPRGVRPSQLAIAWVLAKGRSIVPVIGARTRKQLDDSLGALAIELSPAEIAAIEQAIPASEVAGTRYAAPQMQHLDSER